MRSDVVVSPVVNPMPSFFILQVNIYFYVSELFKSLAICLHALNLCANIYPSCSTRLNWSSSPQWGGVLLHASSCWHCVPSAPAKWVHSQVGWVSWQTAHPVLESPKTAGSQPSSHAPGTHTQVSQRVCAREQREWVDALMEGVCGSGLHWTTHWFSLPGCFVNFDAW